MPSTNKTEHLELNLWEASDRPMRNDFNSDNNLIDSALGGHISDSGIHITALEKDYLKQPYEVKSYSGTGESTQTVALTRGFKVVLIFAKDKPAVSSQKVYCGFGYAGSGASAGLSLSASGKSFTVSQSDTVALNESSVQYIAILFA